MTDDDERKLKQERDSFIKTASIAFAANTFAIQKSVPQADIASRSVAMSLLLWDEFQKWRKTQ